MDCTPITNGNVTLVEPNCVNINNEIVNGIPQYQDMYIFAELTAKSKGRTVIINESLDSEHSSGSKKINFIGNNQDDDPNNPNYLNFTTNYYDGSTEGTHYEGFGINNIKIKINSSFIPQISIQFVDVRGLAFFNQTDSPYRILFDFPPPIFTLTVKGNYGKPLTYQLHLVKYTSEFSAANGNFIIDAQFIAMTFAPLSDILFRYVVNAPLINNEESMNPEPGNKPANTFELILKLKNLYAAVADKLDTDTDKIKLDTLLKDVEKIDLINDVLNEYKDNETLNTAGKPFLIKRTPEKVVNYVELVNDDVPTDEIEPVNLEQFNAYIKTEDSSARLSSPKYRLMVAYVAATNVEIEDNAVDPNLFENSPFYFQFGGGNETNFSAPLLAYKEQLLSENISTISIQDGDIIEPQPFLNSYNIQNDRTNPTGFTKYYAMDITNFYYKLFKTKATIEKEIEDISLELAKKINNMVQERLGMVPSIYNVFEIICNDVDKFFGVIKSTSNDAYISHNKTPNKRIIINDDSYTELKGDKVDIYSFPLVINKLSNREERVAPIQLEKKVDFPELKLVSDFMDTFLIQNRYSKLINARDDQNDDGENKWIPISPFDSILGGATPTSPYIGLSDNVRNEVLRIMLERFYIFTQGTLPDVYIEPTGQKRKDKDNIVVSNAYIELYAEAEAINLIEALSDEKTRQTLEVMSKSYTTSKLANFYSDIKDVTFDYYDGTSGKTGFIYSFPQNDPKYLSITDGEDGRVYVNKDNDGFTGIHLVDGTVHIQNPDDKTDNPVDSFAEKTKSGSIFRRDPADYHFEFTKDNLIYIRDESSKKNQSTINNLGMHTRYLNATDYFTPATSQYAAYTNSNYPGSLYGEPDYKDNDVERQMLAYEQGNQAFIYNSNAKGNLLNYGKDIITVWSDALGDYDTDLIPTLIGSSTKEMSSLLMLSNFGMTASPFNTYSNALNNIVFDIPAVVEVPRFYLPYLGALVHAIENNWVDEIIEYFTIGVGTQLVNRGFLILADLHDVENYLSENDKQVALNAYNQFMDLYHEVLVNGISGLYDLVIAAKAATPVHSKVYYYRYFLNTNTKKNVDVKIGTVGQHYNDVIEPLIYRVNMLNYSQLTFQMPNPDEIGYTSLEQLNTQTGTTKPDVNKLYFTTFFQKLNSLIGAKVIELKEEEEELKKMKGDVDIINQLYYSFKNINDKWLTGTPEGLSNYPFLGGKTKLIDRFGFVDRGMNPIGETILNCEILGDMLEDPNISLFSVLSQLLSLNGFEFFPLQNFLTFDDKAWEDSFRIHTGGYDDTQNTFFVCMYIGGSSSYPSNSTNGFQDDGIIDITEPGIKGITTVTDNVSQDEENINQEKNTDFPFRQVRAFRVRFGEQAQSMFTDIKIDSKEYPETNESIQILSRLAGDQNPDAPVPKGQNLYNLYENRSYKATVTGFGNAMIQPTQYFQLENIPLFNGAYIILDVEHNITANKMTTSFSGTKLAKYPMPRVLSALATTSFDGSSSDAINAANELTKGEFAKSLSQDRVDYLDSELGMDISHWNGILDWNEVKKSNVKYVFIKLTQGKTLYDGDVKRYPNYNLNKNINGAVENDIAVSYYHFASFGRTTNPTTDGIDDANHFIQRIGQVPSGGKPKLPVVLDLEEGCFLKTYKWGQISKPNASINAFTKAFIETMEASGYDVMIYCRTDLVKLWDLYNYSKHPFWVARYMDLRGDYNPEKDEPTIPSEWKDGWTAWQFTPTGMISGVNGGVDLNVMKKSFIKKYT